MADPPTFTSLVPAAGPVQAGPLIAGLDLRRTDGSAADRPYVVANFVSSVDGRATVDGKSRGLGDAGDRAIFHALRERVDAVLAGTGTLAAERYGRLIPDAERRARRVAAGRPAEPLAVTVTRSGHLPLDIPLFAEPDARIVVFSPAPPPGLEAAAAQVIREPLDADDGRGLAAALTTLARDHGVATVLCEGGPTLFARLLRDGLIDELFLTFAPKLAGGGDATAITAGPPLPELAPLRLRGLLQRGATLYMRYGVDR